MTISVSHSHICRQLGWFCSTRLTPGPRVAKAHFSHRDVRRAKWQVPTLLTHFKLSTGIMSAKSPLVNASHTAQLKYNKQKHVPCHHEAMGGERSGELRLIIYFTSLPKESILLSIRSSMMTCLPKSWVCHSIDVWSYISHFSSLYFKCLA